MKFSEQQIESILASVRKTAVPAFNLRRVRNQVLDRISFPEKVTAESGWFANLLSAAPYIRLGAGIMASLLIVVSLTLGVAVAALDSVPGSTIYPFKKIVENLELKFAPNDQKAALQLKFADNRADELQQVLDKNQQGKITDEQAQAIVANTVKELQKTASAAVNSQSKPATIVTKLADIGNKLRAASIQSSGTVKIELEKALQQNQISQEEAIKNLEKAGLKVENSPITIIDDSVTASGKLTAVDLDSVSIGTAKFLLTKDTKYTGMELKDLKIGVIVDITGQIKDNKSYATQITLVTQTKTDTQQAQ